MTTRKQAKRNTMAAAAAALVLLAIGASCINWKDKSTSILDIAPPIRNTPYDMLFDNVEVGEDKTRIIISGQSIEVPAGRKVKIDITETRDNSKFEYKHDEEATGKGTSIKTTDTAAAQSFKSEAPVVSLGKGSMSASGGGTDFTKSTLFDGTSGDGVLYVIGALMILSGIIWIIVTKKMGSGLAIMGGGVFILGIAYISAAYPWIWLVALLAFAVVGGLWLYDVKQRDKIEKVAKSVIGGVEKAGATIKERLREAGVPVSKLDAAAEAAKQGVKDSVKKQNSGAAAATVKKSISDIKDKNGFTSEQ